MASLQRGMSVSNLGMSNSQRLQKNTDTSTSFDLNDLVKCLFLSFNWMYCLLGVMMLVFSLYYTSTSWSQLEGNTMATLSTVLISSAAVMIIIIIGGCAGALNQRVREGPYRGRKLLGLYEIALIAIVVLQFHAVVYILNSIAGLYEVKDDLTSGQLSSAVLYTDFEDTMSSQFNDYYFSTLDKQSKSGNRWFWTFVDKDCPSVMHSDSCTDGSMAQTCPQQAVCEGDDDAATASCPYEMCRLPAVKEALVVLEPIGDYSLFLIIFEIVVVILACLLVCYNPHDNYAQIHAKLMGTDLPKSEASSLAMAKHMRDRASQRNMRGAAEAKSGIHRAQSPPRASSRGSSTSSRQTPDRNQAQRNQQQRGERRGSSSATRTQARSSNRQPQQARVVHEDRV